jgi:hypothetical protein
MPQDWTKPRVISEPVAGFYKVRLCPRGWRVPAKLDMLHDVWTATVDGSPALGFWTLEEFRDLPDTNLAQRVHLYGERIDQAEFDYLNALREFAKVHKPRHPAANPMEAIDLRLQPIDEF